MGGDCRALLGVVVGLILFKVDSAQLTWVIAAAAGGVVGLNLCRLRIIFPQSDNTTCTAALEQRLSDLGLDTDGNSSSHMVNPMSFGADPTGVHDSTQALQAAIARLLAFGNASQQTHLGLAGGQPMIDLGGATLDLHGGLYRVSAPLVIPRGYANLNIQQGTLRASPEFPLNATLLAVGGGTIKGAGVLNLNIMRVTLDGAQRVGAALDVRNGQYVNLGPALMIYGFNAFGIRMNGTGGGYIHNSWLGEMPPSTFTGLTTATSATVRELHNLTATAVSLEGSEHDCYMTDVIIWSALIGVASVNGANTLTHVHTWNLATVDGGIGMFIEHGSGKIVNSYMDFAAMVVQDPKSMIISENLFLGRGNLILEAVTTNTMQDLVITNNRWWSEGHYGGNDTIIVRGNIDSVVDVVIENNVADELWVQRSTRATLSGPVPFGRGSAQLDFSGALLFTQPIQTASCEVTTDGPVVAHVVRPIDAKWPRRLEVGLATNVTGNTHTNISCTVDQSHRLQVAH
ncbi:uncharacterized protein MONBRDRAFT_29580 [Monosiga brevicollis MX1]|uniref:Right handed beta helix domain-containing protein n=1 Tax=Monosiga brevicollis TaxID=81824 RepID=A9VBI3_MONBE|nr:uncharacterized protein MONBRDRAFT_29580 [Monosiga brevicollis MX1]EDQ85067.1 predicted protein [Monosiga brevicollis MX1]|eukprot:XP_001750071.1 hypothetical protein [Monosiga brevicollis MX1]